MTEEHDMVPVAMLGQPMEAIPIQLRLEAEEIESVLDGEHTIAANPLLSNAVGGIRLLVSPEDAERATAAIAEFYQERAEEEILRARTCPNCGSENGVPVRRPFWIGCLVAFTIGAFALLYPWPRYKCPDCKNKWR